MYDTICVAVEGREHTVSDNWLITGKIGMRHPPRELTLYRYMQSPAESVFFLWMQDAAVYNNNR